MTWDETKRWLEERNYCLSLAEFNTLCVNTMARIMTNIDEGDYCRVSIVTIDGIGWNFKVIKNS